MSVSSFASSHGADQIQAGAKIECGFFVTRGNFEELLDKSKQTPNETALSIEREITWSGIFEIQIDAGDRNQVAFQQKTAVASEAKPSRFSVLVCPQDSLYTTEPVDGFVAIVLTRAALVSTLNAPQRPSNRRPPLNQNISIFQYLF